VCCRESKVRPLLAGCIILSSTFPGFSFIMVGKRNRKINAPTYTPTQKKWQENEEGNLQ